MATLTSTACQTSGSGFFLNPPKVIENGVIARTALYNFVLAQSAGDVIQMVPIPKGAFIIDVDTQFTPGAGGPVLTWLVGDGNATNRYQASVSATLATLQRNTGGHGYSYSAEDTIDILIGAVASATAAGSVRLTVTYAMDQSTGGGS